VRPGPVEPGQRPPSGGGNFWQVLAIVALVIATAGWTTAAVLLVRPGQVAEAVPTDDATASDAADDTSAPIPASHTVPALEALLPTKVGATALINESWTGDELLPDDPYDMLADNVTSYLTCIGKTPADLKFALAQDPNANSDTNAGIDLQVRVLEVEDGTAAALRDAQIKDWQDAGTDLTVTTVTVGDKKVTKGDFGAGEVNSWWYISGNDLYDVESSDEAIAKAALTAIPTGPAAPASSGSSATSASAAPSCRPAPSPS
jgi:hypothetical protein